VLEIEVISGISVKYYDFLFSDFVEYYARLSRKGGAMRDLFNEMRLIIACDRYCIGR